jgi:hypothetical protein
MPPVRSVAFEENSNTRAYLAGLYGPDSPEHFVAAWNGGLRLGLRKKGMGTFTAQLAGIELVRELLPPGHARHRLEVGIELILAEVSNDAKMAATRVVEVLAVAMGRAMTPREVLMVAVLAGDEMFQGEHAGLLDWELARTNKFRQRTLREMKITAACDRFGLADYFDEFDADLRALCSILAS